MSVKRIVARARSPRTLGIAGSITQFRHCEAPRALGSVAITDMREVLAEPAPLTPASAGEGSASLRTRTGIRLDGETSQPIASQDRTQLTFSTRASFPKNIPEAGARDPKGSALEGSVLGDRG